MMVEKPIEIRQVSERESYIGENRFYLGEDNILYETIIGEADDEMGKALEEATNILKKRAGCKVNILVDANRAGKLSSKKK